MMLSPKAKSAYSIPIATPFRSWAKSRPTDIRIQPDLTREPRRLARPPRRARAQKGPSPLHSFISFGCASEPVCTMSAKSSAVFICAAGFTFTTK